MTSFNWIWLAIALLLLAPPPVLSTELRRMVGSARRRELVDVVALLRPWQNWLDFFRSLAGSLLLTQGALVAPPSDSGTKMLLLQVGLLSLTLVIQVLRIDRKTSRPEQRIQILAPLFYLSGVTIALSGFVSGVFAVAAGWGFAVAGKNPSYQLPAMALALGATSLAFGRSLELYGNLMLIAIPFALAFVFRKRLAFVGQIVRFPQPALKGSTT